MRRRISGANLMRGEIEELRPERVSDHLIEAALIDEAVVHQRLRDALAVKVRLLRTSSPATAARPVLDEEIGDLLVVHQRSYAASSRLPA